MLDNSRMSLYFRGPVNEDVFAAPAFHGGKIMDSDIQEISEQIHRLLLQVCEYMCTHKILVYFTYLSVALTTFLSSACPQYGLQWLW